LVRGLEDHEVRGAIEELKKSTASIENQIETLQMQQETIASLAKGNGQSLEARASANKAQNKAWGSENVRIAIAASARRKKLMFLADNQQVKELVQSLSYEISELESQIKTTDTSLSMTASEILKADDKLLGSLQKLAGDLDLEKPKDDEIRQRIQELCARCEILLHFPWIAANSKQIDQVYSGRCSYSP
jgi:chromosome segregation ATPase